MFYLQQAPLLLQSVPVLESASSAVPAHYPSRWPVVTNQHSLVPASPFFPVGGDSVPEDAPGRKRVKGSPQTWYATLLGSSNRPTEPAYQSGGDMKLSILSFGHCYVSAGSCGVPIVVYFVLHDCGGVPCDYVEVKLLQGQHHRLRST